MVDLMTSNDKVAQIRYPNTVDLIVGIGMSFLGFYIVVGLAVAAATAGWPPFWPPMDVATAPLEALSTPASVVGLAVLYGGIVIVVGPLFLGWGLLKLWKCWKHRTRLFD
jgi:hypothetical protein